MVVSSYAVMEMDKHDAQPKAQAASVSVVNTSPVDLAKEVVEASADRCPLEVSTFYDVPMDIDLQAYITNECSAYDIDPAIIMAMIDRESDFRADVVGDNGNSFGLMQIQKKWHTERMEDLGCTDLLNPYDNVTVGINYLGELLDRDKGIEWALAAYNAGPSGANSGLGTAYAAAVMKNSEKLKEGMVSDVLFG